MLCATCDHELDERGRCPKCAGVLPEDIERIKHAMIYWIVCSEHGAHEVGKKEMYRREWREPDPKDKRRKVGKHEWLYRCPECGVMSDATVQCFKESIELPQSTYQPVIDDRMEGWRS